jgi:hypothetical protein
MDDSAHSLLQPEDTRPRDSAAPVQDGDVAVTKGNYQQTTPTVKMLVGPWYLDEFGNPTREIRLLD